MAAILAPSEDTLFDAVWGFVSQLFPSPAQPYVFKGFQNMTSTPPGVTYVVISPGTKERTNQLERDYDAVNGLSLNTRRTIYSYQVDCYGPSGPDYADTISIAWRTLWACDYFAGNNLTPTPGAPLPVTPLYADEPNQLNIANGENQYEQRFTCKLYLQANQIVSLPQDFFTVAPPVVLVVADDLPL